MNNVQVLRSQVANVERALNLLSSPEFAQVENLPLIRKEFKTLRTKFNELSRLTNRGRATAELRTAKLKALKKWLEAYTQHRNKTLGGAIPKKYNNKDVLIDTSSLDKYQKYATIALQYMGSLTTRYQGVKEQIEAILEVGRMLETHIDKFELTEEDLPSPDLLEDNDGLEELNSDELEEELDLSKAPTVAPLQMIKTVGALLKVYARFITKVEDKYNEIMPLIARLELVNLDELFPKINQKNSLIQSMFKSLVNINKLLYQSNFHYGLAFRKHYYELLLQCMPYLPPELYTKLRAMHTKLLATQPQVKSPAEEAVDRSVGGIRSYDPLKDPEMNRISPHQSPNTSKDWKPDPKKVKDVSKSLRSLPPAPKALPLPERPQSEPPTSGERLKTEIGEKISPQQRREYERLWEVAAGFKFQQLTKLATTFAHKYDVTL